MKFIIKFSYCFFVLLLISNCSPVSSSWSCRGNVNGSCKTINEIDNGYSENKNINSTQGFKEKIKFQKENNKESISFDNFRSKESVARVVFAPYVDNAGNRHDVSTVYYLEQKAEWKK